MAGSRKSTPSRARSSSVTSNGSVASSKPAKAATGAATTPKSPKSPKSPKAPKEVKSPKATPKEAVGPVTPRKSKAKAEPKLTSAQLEAIERRPPLPKKRNQLLPKEDVPVKLQVINREGEDIIIGRVKLPSTNGVDHAFLLRRFDTNAIAASSMYRLAFPFASVEDERREMEYLEQRYDVITANGGPEKIYKRPRGRPSKKVLESGELPFEERLPAGSSGVKLQGTWIPCADGLELAKEYRLERFARPLIEAKARQSEEGVPILTPSANDTVSTPTSGRSTKILKQALHSTEGSPSAARATKRTKEDGSQEVIVEKSTLQRGVNAEQMEKQIREAQSLAKSIQVNGTPAATPSRKRRAANQSPSARIDPFSDAEDYESANVVVRSFRRGTRVARRRPVATTAGALGAVGAVGAGALAWFAGGNLDVAAQMVQQGVNNLGSWFF